MPHKFERNSDEPIRTSYSDISLETWKKYSDPEVLDTILDEILESMPKGLQFMNSKGHIDTGWKEALHRDNFYALCGIVKEVEFPNEETKWKFKIILEDYDSLYSNLISHYHNNIANQKERINYYQSTILTATKIRSDLVKLY